MKPWEQASRVCGTYLTATLLALVMIALGWITDTPRELWAWMIVAVLAGAAMLWFAFAMHLRMKEDA